MITVLHVEVGELAVDLGFAVAAVSGDCVWRSSGSLLVPPGRRASAAARRADCPVGTVIEHDPVDVVDKEFLRR
jgi:hypothetical protein